MWRKRNLSCVGPWREFPHGRLGSGITDREDGPIKVKTGKEVCSGASPIGKSGKEEGEWREFGRLQWIEKCPHI